MGLMNTLKKTTKLKRKKEYNEKERRKDRIDERV